MNWTFNIIFVIFVCFFVYMYIISASQWLYALECLFIFMCILFYVYGNLVFDSCELILSIFNP